MVAVLLRRIVRRGTADHRQAICRKPKKGRRFLPHLKEGVSAPQELMSKVLELPTNKNVFRELYNDIITFSLQVSTYLEDGGTTASLVMSDADRGEYARAAMRLTTNIMRMADWLKSRDAGQPFEPLQTVTHGDVSRQPYYLRHLIEEQEGIARRLHSLGGAESRVAATL